MRMKGVQSSVLYESCSSMKRRRREREREREREKKAKNKDGKSPGHLKAITALSFLPSTML